MKITALYDARGTILAAVESHEAYDAPVLTPVATRPGTRVAAFDVPESHGKLRLDEICRSLRVDARSRRLMEVKPLSIGRNVKRTRTVRSRIGKT